MLAGSQPSSVCVSMSNMYGPIIQTVQVFEALFCFFLLFHLGFGSEVLILGLIFSHSSFFSAGGIETYFNSVKQKEIMELTGKKEEHNRKMVLYGRKHRVCAELTLETVLVIWIRNKHR